MARPRRSSRFLGGIQTAPESDWTIISRRIKEGTIIPIIGNSLTIDHIFSQFFSEDDQAARDEGRLPLSVDEHLCSEWSDYIGYPLEDVTKLARVALYNRVIRHHDSEEANLSYLRFLKR